MYRPICDGLYRWDLTLSGNSRKGDAQTCVGGILLTRVDGRQVAW